MSGAARVGRPASERKLGSALLAASGVLAVIGSFLALYSSGTDSHGVPIYPFLQNPTSVAEIPLFFLISGFLFAGGSVLLWRVWLAVELGAGFGLIFFGVVAWLYTLGQLIRIGSAGTSVAYVIPYPQTIFPIDWGFSVLCFVPVCWLIERQIARTHRTNSAASGA